MYQITMAYAYWKSDKRNQNSVFDLFFRKNPFNGEYTVFAGLGDCLKFLEGFRFTDDGDLNRLSFLTFKIIFPKTLNFCDEYFRITSRKNFTHICLK